jgi:hypothetical protein
LTATLPRAELAQIVSLLEDLPGVEGAHERRAILKLALPAAKPEERIPDSAVEAGWVKIVDHLAQPPAPEAFERLDGLLAGLGRVATAPGSLAALQRTRKRLEGLSRDRTFELFLARFGLDRDPEHSGGLAFLDQVFVPPVQYEDAASLLADEHVVFIFGDPHMGKTFCAFQLLWKDFRDRGREPIWQRAPVGGSTANADLHALLVPGASIYIEDPFGRTAPLDDIEALLQSLRRLLLEAKRRDVHVVISSRTSVLQATITEHLRENVISLSQELLLESSYDDESLAQIAKCYLASYAPRWAEASDAEAIAIEIAGALRAPHNIQAFLSATRVLGESEEALALLPQFEDIVGELANAIAHFDSWVLNALIVVAATADAGVAIDVGGELYDVLEPDHPPYRSFKDALLMVSEYVNVVGDYQILPRHPSVEEAIGVLTRRQPPMLSATWILIEACERRTGLDRMAIDLLVSFADQWASDPDRIAHLATHFESRDLDVRAIARRTALNHFSDLSAAAAAQICDLAMTSWGDRLLVQLLLHPGNLDADCYESLAGHLRDSGDEQTRFFIADRLTTLREPAASDFAGRLIGDSSKLVRRTAILRIAERYGDDGPFDVEAVINALPQRDQRWLQIQLPGVEREDDGSLLFAPEAAGGAIADTTEQPRQR